ncbi:MAG: hypothetical protein IJ379_05850 [Lachnospiraceae bacterium]|nr:hypothetical protein [Lachnospiraceae bacterium]
MKSKKLLSLLMAGTMVLSLAACGDDTATSNPTPTDAPKATEAPKATDAPADPTAAPVVQEDASIDFEDGNMGFIAPYMQMADAAEVELSVVDYNGSKALQVKNLTGKVPYVAIDATSLLGADVAKVATMEYSIGISNDSGKFAAASGKTFAWSGADLVETSDDWSVYLEKSNPKKAVATLSAGEEFVADAGNIFFINLKTDNGVDLGYGNSTMYIDNIRFLDADGNLLKADSSVAFVAPDGFENTGKDMSNLAALTNVVEWEGFATSAGGWSQAGVAMTDEVKAALVPGSVIEIDYTSETGNMWVVMNESAAGWMRVGVGDADGSGQGYAYVNNSKNTAQITFEQIAQYCTDDVSTWGSGIQCESDGAWEVFAVRVGQAAPVYSLTNAVEFPGYATSAGGWAQAGMDMPQEVIDALVPGSVLEIKYTSETGNMWTVWPGSAKGWMRVGVGDADGSGQGYAQCDGSTCYITYETLVEWLGEDVSTWGTTLQCESDGAWEVYSLRVGTASEFKPSNKNINIEGFATTGGGWAQAGVELTPEVIAALVPGSVLNISYTSETGEIWTVWPGSAKGWMRVGVGNYDGSGQGFAVCDGSRAQITYETLVEWLGEDTSTWGTTLQCEASSNWEVYSVSVGLNQ